MLVSKCDFCDKEVRRVNGEGMLRIDAAEHKPYWVVNVEANLHNNPNYQTFYRPADSMVICEECIERIENIPENQRKGDEIIIGALILTGKFKKKKDDEYSPREQVEEGLIAIAKSIPEDALEKMKIRLDKIKDIGLNRFSDKLVEYLDDVLENNK
ncbi:MAG: hypothetical protein GF375_03485 [Candidatus Omnitrophica bacterium]|nr:hypothetical protein [Candidatus Omnitrophota bacterium]